jgi:mono/diheme cytochrome c family protein
MTTFNLRGALLCAFAALTLWHALRPQEHAQAAQSAPRAAATAADAGDAARLFAERVWPLLKARCLTCHGDEAQKIKGGLDLRSRAGLLKGGVSGRPALTPGEPERSLIYAAVTRRDPELAMPPKENDRLSAEEVELIRQWVAAGAPWPDVASSAAKWNSNAGAGVIVATSGGRSPEWTNRRYKPEDLWAYQPLKRPAVPELRTPNSEPRTPVDAFIRQKLAEKGIHQAAPPADKVTLIRRATFDLTGLPPTPAEVEAFVKDTAPDAYEKLIARLLSSPRYGEQWARHWLDVVRYADTNGFSNDFERPNAWRYRDYVVRSFNADKPYDRFITEQLAGDELKPNDPEMLIAVGFLRAGPWEHTAMTVAAVTRQQFLDDVTHNVGAALLGQGLRCASCHDHKFDPVPTKDYYRMQAVFATTHFAEREVPFLPFENVGSSDEARADVARRLKEAQDALAEIERKNKAAVAAFLKERGAAKLEDLPAPDRSKAENIGLTKEELTLRKVYQKSRDYFARELKRYEPYAFSVYSGPPNNYTSMKPVNPVPTESDGPPPAVHILAGGALESPGEAVTPGVLSAMHASNDAREPTSWNTVPQATQGRRLALARWIASPENTLTARVIVNRVWQSHFGKGLVATPNNFGKMGGKPTHPELLDWLSLWFIEQGWSLKKLHTLIMTSATYRQGGAHPEMKRLQEVDAKNDLLAYFPPRRLAAEEVRDAMLAVTGELNVEAGGPPVFPEINWEVAFQPRHIMGSVAPAYQPSPKRAERNRRTIYAFRYRTLADPLLEVFNRPGSETSCERRDETTVTPQAFALFNGEFAHARALALAAALEKKSPTLKGRIAQAFRLVYGRAPRADEIEACATHVARMTAHHRAHRPQPVALPATVRRQMVEEMTGETASWEERLDGLKNYERDLKPWDAGPQTRALAELCLVLLNSNEFLYVR